MSEYYAHELVAIRTIEAGLRRSFNEQTAITCLNLRSNPNKLEDSETRFFYFRATVRVDEGHWIADGEVTLKLKPPSCSLERADWRGKAISFHATSCTFQKETLTSGQENMDVW
jgi:hypothetical protein